MTQSLNYLGALEANQNKIDSGQRLAFENKEWQGVNFLCSAFSYTKSWQITTGLMRYLKCPLESGSLLKNQNRLQDNHSHCKVKGKS
jgi:hypothetical protein